jgi:pyocin large subunit-like protein
MEQLAQSVEGRAAQMLQQGRSMEPVPAPVKPQPTQPMPAPVQVPTRETPKPAPVEERRTAAQPARATTGIQMADTPGANMGAGGRMKLSEFIQAIRKRWNMSPKQAMEVLGIDAKQFNSLNYPEAFRRLEILLEGGSLPETTGPTDSNEASANDNVASNERPSASAEPTPATSSTASTHTNRPSRTNPSREKMEATNNASLTASLPETRRGATPAPTGRAVLREKPPEVDLAGPPNIPVYPLSDGTPRVPSGALKFDEEIEESEEPEESEVPEEDNGLNIRLRAQANMKIDELKEIKGNTQVSPGRLPVLHNLVVSQIGETRLHQLIQKLWGVTSEKKLRLDQAEALISWAKEDYFEDEVKAVLAALDEQE